MKAYVTLMILTVLVSGILIPRAAAGQETLPAPHHLRTEYLDNPLGLDTPIPRFSWWMRHTERNQRQTAYQILVASSPEALGRDEGDVWDSGRTGAQGAAYVEYGGVPLDSFTRYCWKVRIWDAHGSPSPFSEAAWFEMALLGPGDFQAQWIRGIEDLPNSNGYHSEPMDREDKVQWVKIDLGEVGRVAEVRIYPARPYESVTDEPGFGFPLRYWLEMAEDDKHFINVKAFLDRAGEDQPNPGMESVVHSFEPRDARFLWFAATKLYYSGENKYVLALAEIEALDPEGNNLALDAAVTASSSYQDRGWSQTNLVDGLRISQRKKTRSPLLRKEFQVTKQVARARAYASGLGYYELRLNGAKVGDRVLDPAYTLHHKRTLYSVYDVTDLLRQGPNAAGMMLGHGMYRGTAAAWLQLRIEYEDGTTEAIVTDPSWNWSRGPLVAETLFHGETYDARLEKPGWDLPGYDGADWESVEIYESPPAEVACQTMPPIRVTETIQPISLTPRPDGSVMVDFGQNMAGWVRLQVQGEAGTEVVIKHAELLHDDGSLNPATLRAAKATDTYILRGGEQEVYTPRFTQHGFRYAQVFGYPGTLTADAIEAQVIHTDLDRVGDFECSNALFNKIHDITLWSIRGNSMSIPTDCPQRDERMGWMGDAHLAAEATILNYDTAAYYENWLRTIANSQDEEGHVHDTSPARWGGQDGSPPWAIAYPLTTWYLYRYYGDVRAVEEHYPNIVRWFGTLEGRAKDHIVEYCPYGDWVGVETTPGPLIATGVYYWTAEILAEFATLLGKTDDAAHFGQRAGDIAAAFNERFFNADKGMYGNGSQYSQIWPLYLGIAQEEQRQAALDHLKREIVEKRNNHLATGILGTKYVFDVLTDSGDVDLVYRFALQEDYPSWGYMIANGATTLWELWANETGSGMNSHNHQMFGSIVGWFFGGTAGINTLPEPGYRKFTIAPMITGDLDHAEAYTDTVHGRIASKWERSGQGLQMWIEIPPNTQARVIVPNLGNAGATVLMDGAPPATSGEAAASGVAYELGSGKYHFDVR